MGWTMQLLDTGYRKAPSGLQVVSALSLIFTLPFAYPAGVVLLKLGFPDPTQLIYWWLLPVNSLIVVSLISYVRRRFQPQAALGKP